MLGVCSLKVECRQLLFRSDVFKNKRLTNHSITTQNVSDLDLCELECYLEPNCVSINFKVIPDSEGLHECELNNATHQSHDNDLQSKKGYLHKGAESACDKAVCENGGTRQSDFTDKGYHCVCPLGFTSAHCEQAGECRQLLFPSDGFGNKRLTNHGITTQNVSDLDLCELHCYHEPNCVSINFKVIPDSEGLHKCELNNATHRSHEIELQNKDGYVYKGAESICDRAVCENGGKCQSDCTDKGYHCVCPPGFTSARCEKDVNECLQEPDLCSAYTMCSNTRGSYNCFCDAGYTGDGLNCTRLRASNDSFEDCQEGWVKHNHSFYCMTSYRRHHMKKARQRCQKMSADLPIIKSRSENDFVLNLMPEKYVWLGMKRNNSGFFWFDSSPAEPSQGALYSAWNNNDLEKGNWKHKTCALLELHTKKWKVHKCIYKKNIYILCQKGHA
ncbi:delta-like protein A [Acropora muricata]|uniref:delta-like protein A n=1 Tax=Acropora muricata TaxID=159855 RepID=UPI0034E40E81